MNIEQSTFSSFATYGNLRLGSHYELPQLKFKYMSFLDAISFCESGKRPKGGISECDYGQAVSLGGGQIGADGFVDWSDIPFISNEFFFREKRGRVKESDILLCKDGALTGKTCLFSSDGIEYKNILVNEHVFIVRASEAYLQDFLFYFMRSEVFLNQVKDLAFRKKGQPGLNTDHVRTIRVPHIPIEIQKDFLDSIASSRERLLVLRDSLTDPRVVLDAFFSDYFKVDLQPLRVIDKSITTSRNLSDIAAGGGLMRLSARWNKALTIQSELDRQVSQLEPLGAFITDVKNGWSPVCSDLASSYAVLGLDAINEFANMTFSNLKYSDVEKRGLEAFRVKEGDLFVSRSNTTDLVALSSVAVDVPDDCLIVYPDTMMRLSLSDDLDKQYVAYAFNSFFGRLFFKYAAKGKEQTMVKVSSNELEAFLIPVPELSIQKEIVTQLQREFERQNLIKTEILKIQQAITDELMKLLFQKRE